MLISFLPFCPLSYKFSLLLHRFWAFFSLLAYTLNLTSQRWLTDADFSANSEAKSIWWHNLVVIVPDNLMYKNNASMWITGGGMGNKPSPQSEDILLSAALAVTTGTIVSVLFQVELAFFA
jgi:PhoPQ-activated pathogenicity-related protein